MQMVRNTKTGFEFVPTKELLKFAENPQNNLELVEVEDKRKSTSELDEVIGPVEKTEEDASTLQTFPNVDGKDDNFPPPLPVKRTNKRNQP